MSRILIVEDDAVLRRTLELNLVARGYTVETTATGEDAIEIAGRRIPDLILLDLGLPGIDGMEVLTALRAWTDLPVLVLSARGAENDKVLALDAGANDYLTKPFGVDELMARVRAALRVHQQEQPTVVVTDDFTVDLDRYVVARRDGGEIHLTPIEWGLLAHLVRAHGQLVGQRTLLKSVWGPAYESETNYLRVHLAHLRQKLEPDPSRPRYLITEPGLGIRFVA